MKSAWIENLERETRRLIGKSTDKKTHARHMFDLAFRARRLLENAAETASRDRWDSLVSSNNPPASREGHLAVLIGRTVIEYPVVGQPAVYAALLAAADRAVELSESLYRDWLKVRVDGSGEAG